ncbi:MAG: hypothetical protein QXM08_05940 [Thermofilaceae archaeon]
MTTKIREDQPTPESRLRRLRLEASAELWGDLVEAINRFTFLGGIMLPLTYALSFVAPGSGLRFKLQGDTGIALRDPQTREIIALVPQYGSYAFVNPEYGVDEHRLNELAVDLLNAAYTFTVTTLGYIERRIREFKEQGVVVDDLSKWPVFVIPYRALHVVSALQEEAGRLLSHGPVVVPEIAAKLEDVLSTMVLPWEYTCLYTVALPSESVRRYQQLGRWESFDWYTIRRRPVGDAVHEVLVSVTDNKQGLRISAFTETYLNTRRRKTRRGRNYYGSYISHSVLIVYAHEATCTGDLCHVVAENDVLWNMREDECDCVPVPTDPSIFETFVSLARDRRSILRMAINKVKAWRRTVRDPYLLDKAEIIVDFLRALVAQSEWKLERITERKLR